jgi:hypothetical protein
VVPGLARNLGTLELQVPATRTVVKRNRPLSGGGHVSALRLFQVPLGRLRED